MVSELYLALMNKTQPFNSAFVYRNYICAVVLLCVIALVTGCGGIPLKVMPPDTTASSLGDKVLVYGRLRWIENGEERSTYKSLLGWNINPMFVRIDDMDRGSLSVDKDGKFVWKVARGTYILHQIHWFDTSDGPHTLSPKVAFNIPTGSNTYCLGALVVDLRVKRDLIGGIWNKGWDIYIEDDCESMASEFRSRYTDPGLTLDKSLMIHNQYIPDMSHWKERQRSLDIMRIIMPVITTY